MDRRRFVASTAAAAALAGCRESGPALSGPAPNAAASRPAPAASATVVVVHLAGVWAAAGAQRLALVEKMVAAGMHRLTGQQGADAWRTVVKPDDRVGLKLNCIASGCSTRGAVTDVVARGVLSAGVAAEGVIAWDRSERELRAAGYQLGPQPAGWRVHATDSSGFGYDREVHRAGGVSQRITSLITRHTTALINLPVTKDHVICGTTGALKNHYGSIANPAACHGSKGDPHVADVALLAPIRSRERLVIGDALAIVYEGGPSFRADRMAIGDTLLFSLDPVAHDVVAAQLIDGARQAKGLRPLAACGRAPRYLASAAAEPRLLGLADVARIKIERIELT